MIDAARPGFGSRRTLLSPLAGRWLQRRDGSMIFLLIAGTGTAAFLLTPQSLCSGRPESAVGADLTRPQRRHVPLGHTPSLHRPALDRRCASAKTAASPRRQVLATRQTRNSEGEGANPSHAATTSRVLPIVVVVEL